MRTLTLKLRKEEWHVASWQDVWDVCDIDSPTLTAQLLECTRSAAEDAQPGDWLLHVTNDRNGRTSVRIVEFVERFGRESARVRRVIRVCPTVMDMELRPESGYPRVAQQLGFSRLHESYGLLVSEGVSQ